MRVNIYIYRHLISINMLFWSFNAECRVCPLTFNFNWLLSSHKSSFNPIPFLGYILAANIIDFFRPNSFMFFHEVSIYFIFSTFLLIILFPRLKISSNLIYEIYNIFIWFVDQLLILNIFLFLILIFIFIDINRKELKIVLWFWERILMIRDQGEL